MRKIRFAFQTSARARRRGRSRKRGVALVTTFMLMTLLSVAAVTYLSSSTQVTRLSRRQTMDVQATALCEAGVQAVLRNRWRPFKVDQNFAVMDGDLAGATKNSPRAVVLSDVSSIGKYSAGVVAYATPAGDPYSRLVTVRSVGWFDKNNNDQLDAGEASKVVDVTARFQLARSQVFDYTYFVNNYGWMDGFGQNDLIVNGDMRANGDFAFLNGSPTVNGSVYAAANDKLDPKAQGLINIAPVKMSNATYNGVAANNPRMRQGYSSATHGTKGDATYEAARDYIFDSEAGLVNNRVAGAALVDSTGAKAWDRQNVGNAPTYTTLDTSPSSEVIMPDLSNLSEYVNLSQTYTDDKQFYGDGTANPNYGQPAYLEVWNQSLNSGAGAYQRITTNGVISGSAVIVGTDAKPIKIHGPVTVTQDILIKGTVQGQGTVYTGRNTHVVGSIRYKSGPDFRGSNMQQIDNANEKKDMLALAARGSVMMGDVRQFTDNYPLQYMTPWNAQKGVGTRGRYDENGTWIPPFDAKSVDAVDTQGNSVMRYQSVLGNSAFSISEGINQIDAVLYTNFVGGGNVGQGGSGFGINGTIISRDEAVVVWSLPMSMNYDNRIRERTVPGVGQQPLIQLNLPRSPTMLRSTWQDRGFSFGY